MCSRPVIKLATGMCFMVVVIAMAKAAKHGTKVSPTDIRPALITLHLTDVSPLRALNALTDQAHITIYYPSGEHFFQHVRVKQISLHLDKVPFWSAMLALEGKTGITIYDPYRATSERFIPHLMLSLHHGILYPGLPHCITGAFLLQVLKANWFDAALPKAQRRIALTTAVLLEPPYSIFHVPTHWLHLDKLVDKHHRSLVPMSHSWTSDPYVIPNTFWGLGRCLKFEIPLARCAGGRAEISELKGYLRLDVEVAVKKLALRLHGKYKARAMINHVRILVCGIPWGKKGYEFVIIGDRKPHWTTRSAMADITSLRRMSYDFRVYDAKGREFRFGGGHSGFSNGFLGLVSDYEFKCFPTGQGGKAINHDRPARITLSLPAKVGRVEVPFEMQNISLANLPK